MAAEPMTATHGGVYADPVNPGEGGLIIATRPLALTRRPAGAYVDPEYPFNPDESPRPTSASRPSSSSSALRAQEQLMERFLGTETAVVAPLTLARVLGELGISGPGAVSAPKLHGWQAAAFAPVESICLYTHAP